MGPLTLLDLRWFFDGRISIPLETWFREVLASSEISPADERDHICLFQPNAEDFGIKLRKGKLEIKWRELAASYGGAHGTAGQVERWLKWDWEAAKAPKPEDVDPAFAVPRGPWRKVAKKRWQRKYRWDRAKFIPVPAKEFLEIGATFENTNVIDLFVDNVPTDEIDKVAKGGAPL